MITLNKYMLFIAVLLGLCLGFSPALADTTWVAEGQISGVWTTAGSPYMIQGNDTVAASATLEIGPGVTVYFDGAYKLVVNGLLRAIGAEADSIYFTTDTLEHPNRWQGLRFISANDSCRLEYCVIEHGKATGGGDDRYGGGIECRSSDPVIAHSRISHCYAQIDGGGIYCQIGAAPVLMHCDIGYNYAQFGGGGGMLARNSYPELINCSIHHNSTPLNGGGLMFRNVSVPQLSSCAIYNNSAAVGGGAYCTGGTTIATFDGCTITGNTANTAGGGIASAFSPSIISRCLISGNTSSSGGGISDSTSGLTLTSCLIVDNTASTGGGGVYGANGAATQVIHCTFKGNSAPQGGSLDLTNSEAVLNSSIIAFTPQGAGITIAGSPFLQIHHCDFFSNASGNFTGDVPDLVGVVDTVNLVGDPCDRLGNIFLDPAFADLSGGDFRLTESSPCIAAGGSSSSESDYDGGLRPNPPNSQPDIGAFESELSGGYLYACGELSGTIGPGDVYVVCDISVPDSQQLFVNPGTHFRFFGRYSFTVEGTLFVIGTETDSCSFSSYDDRIEYDWRGLRFTTNSNSMVEYTVIEGARGDEYDPLLGCGGVYVSGSGVHPQFVSCTIRDNVSSYRGGGVACYDSAEPVFHGCRISANVASGPLFIYGGGVYSHDARPRFQGGCEIDHNMAAHRGGGVYLDGSDPQFEDCLIHNNSAPDGAGIYLQAGSAALARCTVYENTASENGGGVFLHSPAVISFSTIRNNNAATGAGVYVDFFDGIVDHCVIRSNIATLAGGGVHCQTSTPIIRRNTIVANQAPVGAGVQLVGAAAMVNSNIIAMSSTPAMYFEASAAAIVRHCDFSGNPGGHFAYAGDDPANGPANLGVIFRTNVNGDSCDGYFNIFMDPLFVNPPGGDFQIQEGSPCIDAGDTQIPIDPDGSIADIGAFYVGGPTSPPEPFDLLLPLPNDTVAADTAQLCWQRARDADTGDTVRYTLHLFTEDFPELQLPIGPDTCTYLVSDEIGLGDSVLVAWWVTARSFYPDTTIQSLSTRMFYWVPSPLAANENVPTLPREFALHGNYPNPFNASTTIRFDLPLTADVKLDVFDVLGRRVATLADDVYSAGQHNILWNTAGVSSGVYFYRLRAGGFEAMRKMVLLR